MIEEIYMELITIIAIITPVITGVGGIILGHKLACSRIKDEIIELENKDKRTEKRHKEEKFEIAIQHYMLSAPSMEKSDRYTNFTLNYNTWKLEDRLNFFNKNQITELSDFFNWMSEKFDDAGEQMSSHDFWKRQIK